MKKLLLIMFCHFTFLSGCAVYTVDIQQGNVVEQKMLDQLKIGMPAQKVRLIMGTPLVEDVFHQRRWEYVYSFQSNGKKREQRHITLFFDEKDELIRVEGDVKVSQIPGKPSTPYEELNQQVPIL